MKNLEWKLVTISLDEPLNHNVSRNAIDTLFKNLEFQVESHIALSTIGLRMNNQEMLLDTDIGIKLYSNGTDEQLLIGETSNSIWLAYKFHDRMKMHKILQLKKIIYLASKSSKNYTMENFSILKMQQEHLGFYDFGDKFVEIITGRVYRLGDKSSKQLRKSPMDVLRLLVENQNFVVTHEIALSHFNRYNEFKTHLRMNISYLRKELELEISEAVSDSPRLLTVRGQGYKVMNIGIITKQQFNERYYGSLNKST